MTPRQRQLARHALGLPNERHRSYRNYFVATLGHVDRQQWFEMVVAGYATSSKGGTCFHLTPIGAMAALETGEQLCPEDFPVAA